MGLFLDSRLWTSLASLISVLLKRSKIVMFLGPKFVWRPSLPLPQPQVAGAAVNKTIILQVQFSFSQVS